MMYDAAIIGTGPAGLSAAINLRIHQKSFIWFGSKALSDKIRRAERIANYPGLPDITGEALTEAFQDHIQRMDLEICERMVNTILPMGKHYALMAGSDYYEAKTLIFATGVANVGTIPGEEELLGRGVSYCATCDGSLYRGKTIAVVCGNPRFAHEVKYLAELAQKVYCLPLYKNPEPMADNVELLDSRITQVNGEKRVESVTLKDGSILPVDGLFCLRDAISLSTLLPGLATENGHIVVDRNMATNLPGCYAAGDCTGRPYQYVKAAGEGNAAAHSVIAYLAAV